MALTLVQFRNKVRVKTRSVNDTARLTNERITDITNEVISDLRTELQQIAPAYGLCEAIVTLTTTGNQIGLTGVDPPFEQIYRLDMWNTRCSRYLEVKRAGQPQPYTHQIAGTKCWPTWERRGTCIWLHPEDKVLAGSRFRILYYATPDDLETPGDDAVVLSIPAQLERVAVYRACAEVAITRGEPPAAFQALAEKRMEAVMLPLQSEYGVHDEQQGLVEEMLW